MFGCVCVCMCAYFLQNGMIDEEVTGEGAEAMLGNLELEEVR